MSGPNTINNSVKLELNNQQVVETSSQKTNVSSCLNKPFNLTAQGLHSVVNLPADFKNLLSSKNCDAFVTLAKNVCKFFLSVGAAIVLSVATLGIGAVLIGRALMQQKRESVVQDGIKDGKYNVENDGSEPAKPATPPANNGSKPAVKNSSSTPINGVVTDNGKLSLTTSNTPVVAQPVKLSAVHDAKTPGVDDQGDAQPAVNVQKSTGIFSLFNGIKDKVVSGFTSSTPTAPKDAPQARIIILDQWTKMTTEQKLKHWDMFTAGLTPEQKENVLYNELPEVEAKSFYQALVTRKKLNKSQFGS